MFALRTGQVVRITAVFTNKGPDFSSYQKIIFVFISEKPKPIELDDSSSDEEPLAKKAKKQPPTVSTCVV